MHVSLSLKAFPFKPRLIDALRGYTTARLLADLFAGVTVGIIALPLAIAFAIASGLRPEAGIFTAVVAGMVVSGLGGTRIQIGGPAGAFIVIVYGIVEQYGVANLLLATMLAGGLLVAMGVFRLGGLIRQIPVSIVIGFTNGIAVLIALSQVKDFVGLRVPAMPAEFFAKLHIIATHWDSASPATMALGLASLAVIVIWPKTYAENSNRVIRILSQIPGTIVAVVFGAAVAHFGHLDVATIGSAFGGIPQGLPPFALPDFDWQSARHVLAPATTIALLAAIETLLCARVADSLTHDRHDPNQELMALGLANIAAPLFGGFCATGTIARTVANIRSGATSPIAGIVHALTLLVILLVAAPLAEAIPLTSLAAILMFVSYTMGDWNQFLRMTRFSVNYRTLVLTTFALTVIIDLTVAVEVGLGLACLFFITRITSLTSIEFMDPIEGEWLGLIDGKVETYRLQGSLFFGSVGKMEGLLDPNRPVARLTILEASGLLNLDTTGLESLETLYDLLKTKGGDLMLCGLNPQPYSLIRRSGFADRLGPRHIFDSVAGVADYVVKTRAIQ